MYPVLLAGMSQYIIKTSGELPEGAVYHIHDNYYIVHTNRTLFKRDEDLYFLKDEPKQHLFKRDSWDIGETVPKSIPNDEIKKFMNISDPIFNDQWHFTSDHHLNTYPAWKSGHIGTNVTVAILDDGIDFTHPDLLNFCKECSYDFNDHRQLPIPTLYDDYHGTRCAGEIAAAINDKCGVGVAPNATISGIRILGGSLTTADEALAVNHEMHKNDIYSCSWGPSDDGVTIEGPPEPVLAAFKKGIEQGRNGKGNIFVFASGNGGLHNDDCNYDGYTNMHWVVTVGATDIAFKKPSYSENCAAQLGVTLSSGSGKAIVTTNWRKNGDYPDCVDKHGGTSAAAPLAAGMIALFLAVRPDLTWRDVQHIVLKSARPFKSEPNDWQSVAENRKFSHYFGYGLLDASHMVTLATNWTLVNKEVDYKSPIIMVNNKIEDVRQVESSYLVVKSNLDNIYFGKLEHVTVTLSIDHETRGDLEITLISPHNYKSYLAKQRPSDYHSVPMKDWTMSTVVHFGEDPVGLWKIQVRDGKANSKTGTFIKWQITFMGSATIPNPPKQNLTPSNETITTPTPAIPDNVEYKGGSNGTILAVFVIFGFVGFAFYYFKKPKYDDHQRLKDEDMEERQVLHDANEFFEDDFELESMHHSSPGRSSSPRKHIEID